MTTNDSSSTTSKWLTAATARLNQAGIATARLDALVLLEDATGRDRSYLLAHPETELKGTTLKLLDSQIERRVKHEPLAYIRGKSEFYGREFKVTPHTLQPRPETETMIYLLKKLTLSGVRPANVVDVGTGSGCLGITAKLELPGSEVIGVDISGDCLRVARENAKKLNAKMRYYKGDLLEPVKDMEINVLLCNLPYVPDGHTINEAAMFEPRVAIFGGEDGLDLYRRMFEQIKAYVLNPELVLTESLPFQHKALASMAKEYGYALSQTEDFIQVFTA